MCFSVHPHVPEAEVYIINSPMAIRTVQGRSSELPCVLIVINAAKFDTAQAVRTYSFEVKGEGLYF